MYIGIDTSNYTTSVAAYDGEHIWQKRKIIDVPIGKRGMRQSECIFAHVSTLGGLMEALAKDVDIKAAKGIGVSVRPRRVDTSYMPVFLAGLMLAKSLAATLDVPLYPYSHQEGHIMAALISHTELQGTKEPFLFLHLSGGTTEWVKCQSVTNGFDTDILAATADISAGQLLDRVGVNMGLSFPCGSYLDAMATAGEAIYDLPVNVKKNTVNFSGCEAEISRIMERENYDCKNVAKSVLCAIGKSVLLEFANIFSQNDIKSIVIAGGVASSNFLRQTLKDALAEQGKNVFFAENAYSSDNAVGIAALALKEWQQHGK